MNKVLAIIKILRPMNLVFCVMSLIITAFLVDKLYDGWRILLTGLVIVLFAGAGNILNDIFDFKIDKINRPNRPLPKGIISLIQAKISVFGLFGLGISLTYFLNPLARVIALIFVLPLLIFYTPVLKKIPILGNIAIASVLGLVFVFSEASITGNINKMWIPSFLAFGLSWIRELAKDMQDIIGDRQNKVFTFPSRYGIPLSFTLYGFLAGLLSILSLLPFIHRIYGLPYLILLFIGIIIPLMVSVIYLKKHQTPEDCGKIANLLKILTLVGLVVIFSTGF